MRQQADEQMNQAPQLMSQLPPWDIDGSGLDELLDDPDLWQTF
jgi:hypothetical protein